MKPTGGDVGPGALGMRLRSELGHAEVEHLDSSPPSSGTGAARCRVEVAVHDAVARVRRTGRQRSASRWRPRGPGHGPPAVSTASGGAAHQLHSR